MCVQAPLCAHLGTKGNAKHPLSVSTLLILSLNMELSIFFYDGWSMNSKNLPVSSPFTVGVTGTCGHASLAWLLGI